MGTLTPGGDRRLGAAASRGDGGRRGDRVIAAWLLTLAGMVFGMVVLGGLTRLTHSGLSMVEWQPLTGWLPPLDQEAWEATFRAYQRYPEFRLLNPDMTLDGFKEIFWLEFIHRLWGRLTGVVFAVPFIVFLALGWVRGRVAAGCAVLFVIGGLQGVLGWYMVASGLVDRPDVSPYRLTAHFVLALALFGALVWLALGRLAAARGPTAQPAGRPAGRVVALAALILVTLASGGFVAGTDAGYHFNTFPLMDGGWLPPDPFVLEPLWRNAFETVSLVQFNHRLLAMLTLAAVLAVRFGVPPRAVAGAATGAGPARRALTVVVVLTLLQAGLGIATLLLHMPLALAALHQANGVLLWGAAVAAVFLARSPVAAAAPIPATRAAGPDGPPRRARAA